MPLEDTHSLEIDGRKFDFVFRPSAPHHPCLVVLHGHSKNPRPSKLRSKKFNVLCPVDSFGYGDCGSWFLGEDGDFFWLKAMPRIINHVYKGNNIFFIGSSMGGYGAILHGALNKASGVYANIPQTVLLDSQYSAQGMHRFFKHIFGADVSSPYNDLKLVVDRGLPTFFDITATRWDKDGYLQEQVLDFVSHLTKHDLSFSFEVVPVHGHGLVMPLHEAAERLLIRAECTEELDAEMQARGANNISFNTGVAKAGKGKKNIMSLDYSYEEITNLAPSKAVKRADEVLLEGWGRRQYGPLDLSKPIPWELDDPTLRSWNFYIHSLDMIDPLLAAHSQTGDQEYLIPALRIGLDWVDKHPRQAGDVSSMAWYDMAVGLRAYRLGYLYQAADQAGLLNLTQKAALWVSLDEHRVELSNDANIVFHNNHGYFQVAGQLALGRRFQQVTVNMAELYSQGEHRLRRMLDQQFGRDGVHREHSPDYHRMVADTLLGLVRAGLVEDPELLGRVDAIENALAWFVTPEGVIANFGDSDSRKMTYSAEGASRKWTTPLMRAVASNGATGKGWPKGLQKFPDSGYAIVRSPNPNATGNISQDSYLAQTAAFHSRTHKHCDDLSFIWHEGGQPLLVDAGRYGYIGKTETGSDLWQDGFWYSDPMRMFMESTRAHNTLEFDGLNAQRKGVKPYGSALVQACQKSGIYSIETRCKQHGSIWHDRLLLLQPGKWLVVFDVYTDNLKEPHDVRQWFHFAPGHRATQVSEGYNVDLKDNSQMALRSLIGVPNTDPVISGRKADPIQGWWSEKERSVIPAEALCFTQTGQMSGVFATLLTLSAGDEVMVEQGRSNVTGRKAQLAWSDNFGHHNIAFERGENLFVLDYNTQLATSDRVQPNQALDREMEKLFSQASVVLEYGSALAPIYMGTVEDLHVFCAIRGSNCAIDLRQKGSANPESLTIYQGKESGHTLDATRRFAAEIWGQSWFVHPDIIVISGSDAVACLAEVQNLIDRKTTVIWKNFEAHPRHAYWKESIYSGRKIADNFIFDIVPLTSPSEA